MIRVTDWDNISPQDDAALDQVIRLWVEAARARNFDPDYIAHIANAIRDAPGFGLYEADLFLAAVEREEYRNP